MQRCYYLTPSRSSPQVLYNVNLFPKFTDTVPTVIPNNKEQAMKLLSGFFGIFTLLILLIFSLRCSNEVNLLGPGNNSYIPSYGEVQLSFPIDDRHVPQRCIKRADLSIAYTADSLYRKEFLTVANVSNYQSLYKFHLEPGLYYYQAGKTCVCGGDTCLWGGYPGGLLNRM